MFIKGAEHPHETTRRDHKQNGHNQTHPAAFGTQIAFMGYPGSFSHRHTQTHTRRLTCARLYIPLRSRSLSYYCISHILHYNKALPPSHPPPSQLLKCRARKLQSVVCVVELGHLATGGLFLLPARSPQALGHFVFEYTLIKWPRLAAGALVTILHLGHRIMFIHCSNLLTHEMRIHAKISLPSHTHTVKTQAGCIAFHENNAFSSPSNSPRTPG